MTHPELSRRGGQPRAAARRARTAGADAPPPGTGPRRGGEKSRLQKLLEEANIKLTGKGVLSDVFGASGEAMLEAVIVKGEADPAKIAALAQGTARKKMGAIAAGVDGYRLPETHRFLMRAIMEHLAVLVGQIEKLDRARSRPKDSRSRSRYCKRFRGWERWRPPKRCGQAAQPADDQGNPCFRAMLNQSGWASARKGGSEFQSRYQRPSPKHKHNGAVIAVAHALVYAIYEVLKCQRPYRPVGEQGLDQQETVRLIRHHQRRLRKLRRWLPKAPKLSPCSAILRKLDP
jgi:hypothetical protein